MSETRAVRQARVNQLAAHGEAARIRRRAGISMRMLASSIGVAPSTVMRWERGERQPSGTPALRYLTLLDALAAHDQETP